jgi:hypothetical protein
VNFSRGTFKPTGRRNADRAPLVAQCHREEIVMPSGGARTRSGPAKDPNSIRSAMSMAKGEWRTLPATHDAVIPDCPLPDASEEELAMWETYWRKPQAIIWAESGMEIEVALHVRHLVESLAPKAPSNSRTLASQQLGSLLLTHKAMQDARIRIGDVEPEASAPKSKRPSARERRLAAVPDASA